MSGFILRALVVDDESAVRHLTMRSLTREGFLCDEAADGGEARELLESRRYDLVVTDLRMPNANGHALVVDLLGHENRPLIAVLTGVVEPRLAKDLVARGVDELTFKPVDFNLFAAKLKAMVSRHASARMQRENRAKESSKPTDESVARSCRTVDGQELEDRLSQVSKVLPISAAALEVYKLTSHGECSGEIASAIRRDPALVAEVLRLANSAFYNPTAEKITDLGDAVLRIGQRRLGELALATNALSATTAGTLPWMNTDILARRSLAAGLAVECLVAEGGHRHLEKGLLIGTIMHSLGRIVLGTLWPQCYEEMLIACRARGEALAKNELQVFGQSQSAVMARLLRGWGIPSEVYLPLKHIEDDYAAMVGLSEPIRTKSELIKLAVVVGQIAVGRWETYDLLDLPPSNFLKRLRIESAHDIIARVRLALKDASSPINENSARPTQPAPRQITYYHLAGGPIDLLAQVLETQGFKLVVSSKGIAEATPAVVNCLDAPFDRLRSRVNPGLIKGAVIVCSPETSVPCSAFGTVAQIPGAFDRLMHALIEVTEPAAVCQVTHKADGRNRPGTRKC